MTLHFGNKIGSLNILSIEKQFAGRLVKCLRHVPAVFPS